MNLPYRTPQSYSVGIICALAIEKAAIEALLDEEHPSLPKVLGDENEYTFGKIGYHNVIVACLPAGLTGKASAAVVAKDMSRSFQLGVRLMVGIGGGVWSESTDIRLGDVVVSQPDGLHGGILQWDFGKTERDGVFRRTGSLNKPPRDLLNASQRVKSKHMRKSNALQDHLSTIKDNAPSMAETFSYQGTDNDRLFEASYPHNIGQTCDQCDLVKLVKRVPRSNRNPEIHYGNIASGDQVMKDASSRDKIAKEEGIICFEMEAAGLMDSFPCLVIRGICDYADSHKNKRWQPYAAATAAAYAKDLILSIVHPQDADRFVTADPVQATTHVSSRAVRALHVPTGTGNSVSNCPGPNCQTPVHAWQHSIPHEPFSTTPFGRDLDFVDREELGDIHAKCSRAGARVALVGLGGVGKSQLAIQYSYQVRENSPYKWVFWIHASSRARFEQGYKTIADRLGIVKQGDRELNVLQAVQNWLCDERNGQWVMVVDNADDATTFYTDRRMVLPPAQMSHNITSPASLASLLPQSPNGSILFTSRNEDLAFRLTGDRRNIIPVGPMDHEDGLSLLHRKLDVCEGKNDRSCDAQLLKALEYMPLAITQAAAYICRLGNRGSVLKYLQIFQRNETSRTSLLNRDVGDLRRDVDAQCSVITTWQISFDQIRRERPSASDLLSLMSFFNRQGIPDFVLRKYAENNDYDSDGHDPDIEFEEDVSVLRSYHMITTSEDHGTFEMHGLVQLSTRTWLKAQGKLALCRQRFLAVLAASFPSGDWENGNTYNWKICQVLIPHAEVAEAEQPDDKGSLRRWDKILHTAAAYLWEMGNYEMAERMAMKASKAMESNFGFQDPDTFGTFTLLALVLKAQGKYEMAERLNRRVLETRENLLGETHPDTLMSFHNLAVVLRAQGRYSEAQNLARRALNGNTEVLGSLHPDTLTSANGLAEVLQEQGKNNAAELIHRKTLQRRDMVLGCEHPETLTSANGLAMVLLARDKHEEAEAACRRALEGRRRVLGNEHPPR